MGRLPVWLAGQAPTAVALAYDFLEVPRRKGQKAWVWELVREPRTMAWGVFRGKVAAVGLFDQLLQHFFEAGISRVHQLILQSIGCCW